MSVKSSVLLLILLFLYEALEFLRDELGSINEERFVYYIFQFPH